MRDLTPGQKVRRHVIYAEMLMQASVHATWHAMAMRDEVPHDFLRWVACWQCYMGYLSWKLANGIDGAPSSHPAARHRQ